MFQHISRHVTEIATIPDDHYDLDYIYDKSSLSATKLARGLGVQDSDYIVYISYSDTNCGTSTLAWATPCVQDQYGRPIAGGINFCSSGLTSQYWKQDVLITLHEITHAMIMSPSLWDDFIDNNGGSIEYSDVIVTKTLPHDFNQSYIVTNKVKLLAQQHFDCYDESIMPGLPLEDDGGSGSASSHWEVMCCVICVIILIYVW